MSDARINRENLGALRARRLNDVFGGLRAEYFRKDIFKLFTLPTYWPELLTGRPCLLVGGRGTGKTTALRGLSYQGQEELVGDDFRSWNHVGLYWRVNTNVVRAFRSSHLSEERWERIFAHYVNLILVGLICDFSRWVADKGENPIAPDLAEVRRCARALGLQSTESIQELADQVDDSIVDFEATINNIDGGELPFLSVLGRPMAHVCRAICNDDRMDGKNVYFLVDEYENFDDYQQRVFNTLIKHSGDERITFKVGMRATGHRERATLSPTEHLIEPADYALIDIAQRLKDEDFAHFARQVCEERLRRIGPELGQVTTMDALLPSLTEEAEAQLLGVDRPLVDLRRRLLGAGAQPDEIAAFDAMSGLAAYMIQFFADSQGAEELEMLRFSMHQTNRWANRLTNYQHAALYTIRQRKRGVSKYYSGWGTYVLLADGNIRYLLLLVNEAMQAHLRDGFDLSEPVGSATQTMAAQAVGRRAVEQLQGASAEGADLTRLVLSLGRVFQVMAASPQGHTPEVSQFRVSDSNAQPYDQFSEGLLNAAVMHLTVRRFAGDKLAAVSGEIREFNYQLHPIFAPFFVFSYRSKRRMELSTKDLHGLVKQPRATIREILERSSRSDTNDLPEQLDLFREYFGDSLS